MASWQLLLATWPARIVLGLSLLFHLAAIVFGYLLLLQGEKISGAPVYFGMDLPSLLFIFPTRLYLPDCEILFGRKVLESGLGTILFIANVGYLLWLIAMPGYWLRVLRYRPAPHRVFQHPDDKVGLPVVPELVEQARIAATVQAYPRRQTLFYVSLILFILLVFGALIHSGFLIHQLCGQADGISLISLLMPLIQVGSFAFVELAVIAVVYILFIAREE